MANWNADIFPRTRGSYAKLMAICALSEQRVTSGGSEVSAEIVGALSRETYLEEACNAMPKECEELRDFETLQALHLLCVTAMERGEAQMFHQFMGLYHAATADQGFSDERRWPSGIARIEREERRRLYWHMYRLEIHTSLILGHVIRISERQASVAYPDMPDNDISNSTIDSEWLSGWNYVTDLYRGLEHLIIQFRIQRMPAIRPRAFASSMDQSSRKELVDELEAQFVRLPQRFKKASDMSNDVRRNRCGYQVANISCEYHASIQYAYHIKKLLTSTSWSRFSPLLRMITRFMKRATPCLN
jgi:hypothetical protein